MIENLAPQIWMQNLSEYQIFDIRTPSEWKDGILDGAICINLHDDNGILNPNFIDEIKKQLPKNEQKIAFICHSGHRSRFVCEWLWQEFGISSVNLDGGMQAVQDF